MGTMAGKLKGVIPAQTPRGWRKLAQSRPLETFSTVDPWIRVDMPQANSTTSMPRLTDPRASSGIFPFSREIQSASSSRCSSNSCL